MTKAIYHNAEGLKDVECQVLKQYEIEVQNDGDDEPKKLKVVDLGDKDGNLVIGRCRIEKRPGACSLVAPEPAKK